MSTTRAQVNLAITASEEFTAAEAPGAGTVSDRTIKSGSGNSLNTSLNATSTPSVTKPPISLKVTIGGSPTTLDLTAISGLAVPPTATRTLDLTGAKVVAYMLRAADANVGAVTVGVGAASNPYPLFGTGKDIVMGKGMQIGGCSRVASQLPAVSPTVKELVVSGTSADILYIDLYTGT